MSLLSSIKCTSLSIAVFRKKYILYRTAVLPGENKPRIKPCSQRQAPARENRVRLPRQPQRRDKEEAHLIRCNRRKPIADTKGGNNNGN